MKLRESPLTALLHTVLLRSAGIYSRNVELKTLILLLTLCIRAQRDVEKDTGNCTQTQFMKNDFLAADIVSKILDNQ